MNRRILKHSVIATFLITLFLISMFVINASVSAVSPSIDISHLILNGNGPSTDQYPRLIGDTLRLLPDYDINDPLHQTDSLASAGAAPSASAWYGVPLQVRDGFTTTFQFNMWHQTGGYDWEGPMTDTDGADGFAFVIQNDPLGEAALGVGAGGLGYEYIRNAVALEFDTWRNAPWYGEPNGNHISLHSSKSVVENFLVPHHTGIDPIDGDASDGGGILTSTQCTTEWPGVPGYLFTDFWRTSTEPYYCFADPDIGSIVLDEKTSKLNDGQWHSVKIEYVPGNLKVHLDSLLVLETNVDLDQLLDLSDGSAFFGFTSGERGGYQNHDIQLWNYEPVANIPEGFVTGGGWIDSPAGAYKLNTELTGKATFGFVSKYNKGASVPDGNTEFIFHAAGMKFKSTSYQWLVVAGSKAQFKGEGTVNGVEGYSFMLTAKDGGSKGDDLFRIKIWNADGIVYDNQLGSLDGDELTTVISGGSIVVHK